MFQLSGPGHQQGRRGPSVPQTYYTWCWWHMACDTSDEIHRYTGSLRMHYITIQETDLLESTLHYVCLVERHICYILNVRWFENVKLPCESLIFFNTCVHEYAFKWCENQCLLFCDNSNYVVEMGLSPLMNRQWSIDIKNELRPLTCVKWAISQMFYELVIKLF